MDEYLNIISLEAAKNHLVIDFPDYDEQITGIIATACSWVEKYTGYYFYQRPIIYPITSYETSITDFPLQITSVIDSNNNQVSSFLINISKGALRTYIIYNAWNSFNNFIGSQINQSFINALVGYTDPTQIPHPLIAASYKLITYLFQNKDMYNESIPEDIQMLLNQWRRGSSGI